MQQGVKYQAAEAGKVNSVMASSILVKLIFLAVLLASARATAQERQDVAPSCPRVVATGEATVREMPDRAVIAVGTEARAREPEPARQGSAQAMNAVRARLEMLGFADPQIRTVRYELRPEFDFIDGKRTRRGYVAVNTIEVRIDDMSRIGRTIDAIVQAGANIVGDPRYDLKNRDAVEDEALKQAVVDARASADAAASGAGLSVQRILRIEQHDTGSRPPVPMMMAAPSAEEATTPIVPGPIEIKAAVTLTACMR